MKKTIFEEMGGTYIRHGDYLIPCLTLPEEEQRFIGVWGQRHLRYLKEYRRGVYLNIATVNWVLCMRSDRGRKRTHMRHWTIICRRQKWEMRCAIAMSRGYTKAVSWANLIYGRQ